MDQDVIKASTHALLPKKMLTSFAGFLANIKNPMIKNFLIRRFIKVYQVNMQEARLESPNDYACFNDFFIRRLKPESRPIATADIISPVDGFLSEFGAIQNGTLLQAKGRHYSVRELLNNDSSLPSPFDKGQFATLYLSPRDYHRIHMPLDACLKDAIYVPGKLFSVQPSCVRSIPRLFSRNERLILIFDTKIGPMAMVLVGATLVGAIATRWHGEIKRTRKICHLPPLINPSSIKTVAYETSGISTPTESPHTLGAAGPSLSSSSLADFMHSKLSAFADNNPGILSTDRIRQGEEMGYFKLGSTVIVLFGEGKEIEWRSYLSPGIPLRYGEALARIV